VKRLLLDQGLPRSVAATMVGNGWDVIHVAEIGMSRAADIEILQRAGRRHVSALRSRVCVTLDADFHSLLAVGGEAGPSVIRIRREGLHAAAVVRLLQDVWPAIEEALDGGAIVTVTERSVRIRRLPVVRP
jgi:predicted nuclease of predicted toxin-antitoxin system